MTKPKPRAPQQVQILSQEEPEMDGKAYRMTIYFRELGGHTHLVIWTGPTGFTLGKAGYLTMTNEEFDSWKRDRMQVEFIPASKGEPA